MLIEEKLPFPGGIACGETLREIYAQGTEAMKKVKLLIACALSSIALKISQTYFGLTALAVPLSMAASQTGALAKAGFTAISLKNLTFGFEPSVLMVGVGGLVGWRGCWSLMLGSIIAWGIVGPSVLETGWMELDKIKADGSWYNAMLKWLLWPGVSMMVFSSLTSFAFSWKSILAIFTGKKSSEAATVAVENGIGTNGSDEKKAEETDQTEQKESELGDRLNDEVSNSFLAGLVVIALILSVILQVKLFSIVAWAAAFGVLMSLFLAIVAGRVSGETNVTPVGAMGKVTQLLFGLITPGNAASNLMAANVTGGSASQCADLLHDFKTGLIVGNSPRLQTYSQLFGALAGSLVGSAAYLLLIPDPKNMLMTDEWPAPAVASWLAVAEIFKVGLSAMPEGTMIALIIGGVIGIVLALAEKWAPKNAKAYIPSPASIGLAFVIPAYNAVGMFSGGIIALVLAKFAPNWHGKYLTVAAAGLIAGESFAGVLVAVKNILM
jgi:OPT family oligopeptide transporter